MVTLYRILDSLYLVIKLHLNQAYNLKLTKYKRFILVLFQNSTGLS